MGLGGFTGFLSLHTSGRADTRRGVGDKSVPDGARIVGVLLLPSQPDVNPGNCWAFRGSQGFAIIRLSDIIRPTAVTLEHIPKALSPQGAIPSAPKDFAVYVSTLSWTRGRTEGTL